MEKEENKKVKNTNRTKIKKLVNRKTKDSIFTSLFSDKKYLLELYKELHQEDSKVTQDDIDIVTLQNVLVNGMYNDLGFIVKDKLIVFVESQSTYSSNIQLRMLLYTAKTIKEYIDRKKTKPTFKQRT